MEATESWARVLTIAQGVEKAVTTFRWRTAVVVADARRCIMVAEIAAVVQQLDSPGHALTAAGGGAMPIWQRLRLRSLLRLKNDVLSRNGYSLGRGGPAHELVATPKRGGGAHQNGPILRAVLHATLAVPLLKCSHETIDCI